MSKTHSTPEGRRIRPLSPDVAEILHMLAALESQPRSQQQDAAGK